MATIKKKKKVGGKKKEKENKRMDKDVNVYINKKIIIVYGNC